MNDVAGQDDEAGILEMDKQRLAAWGVPWRGNQSDAPVAERIGITVDELKVLRSAQELTRQCHQLIYVVVWPVAGILSSYTQLAVSGLWSWGTSPRYLCGPRVCAILQHERYRVASTRFRRVDLSASCRGDRRSI